MSRWDFLLWVAFPYLCIATFAAGHVWRYRRDQHLWTARPPRASEWRTLYRGAILFHLGIFAVIGGHVLGILVPRSWTRVVGVGDTPYHWISLTAGGLAGAAVVTGLAMLVFRRLTVGRVGVTTTRSDLVLYPVLAATIVLGMLAVICGSAIDEHLYRTTVSPWFRGIVSFGPNGELMAAAPLVFRAHAFTALLLFAIWPFTRLVHVWFLPITLMRRAPVLFRARQGAPARLDSRSEDRVSP